MKESATASNRNSPTMEMMDMEEQDEAHMINVHDNDEEDTTDDDDVPE